MQLHIIWVFKQEVGGWGRSGGHSGVVDSIVFSILILVLDLQFYHVRDQDKAITEDKLMEDLGRFLLHFLITHNVTVSSCLLASFPLGKTYVNLREPNLIYLFACNK